MFYKKPTEKQVVGRIGEDFSCDYLKKNSYKIVDRNYLKKWGEIDIVAKKGDILHFVEVKTVSRDTFFENVANNGKNVAHETGLVEPCSTRAEPSTQQRSSLQGEVDEYRPEDNVHPWKLQRMSRVIQSYLLDKDVSDETDWQFDIITVYLDKNKRLVKIELLDDIVL